MATKPYGFCQCGCGQETNLARDNDAPRGRVKGEPMRYCIGHNRRKYRPALPKGFLALDEITYTNISECDHADLSQFTWRLSAGGYVVRLTPEGGSELMHRRIMKALPGQYVDHIDHDPLNNERHNLRICTNSENNMNRFLQSNNHSGYKGVSWSKVSSRWRAYIKARGKQIHLGLFDSKEAAARAYNAAVPTYHGEFGLLNEVPNET